MILIYSGNLEVIISNKEASELIKSKGWLPNLFHGIVAKAKNEKRWR